MMRRLAIKLNSAGIWPIYSTFNGFNDTKYRDVRLQSYGSLSLERKHAVMYYQYSDHFIA